MNYVQVSKPMCFYSVSIELILEIISIIGCMK